MAAVNDTQFQNEDAISMPRFGGSNQDDKMDNIEEVKPLDESLDVDPRCGYGSWTPSFLQKFNDPKVLLACACWFTFTQGLAVHGFTKVNTVTLERRFDLSSAQVASISSAYSFSAGLSAIPVSYLGSFVSKPRMMSVGAVVMGMGSFVMFLPHLLAGTYQLGQKGAETCHVDGNGGMCENEDYGLSRYLYVFITGQILHGFGGTTIFILAIPFFDDNVKARDTPLYIGILISLTAIGVAVGFVIGGQFLNIYVDIGRVDMNGIAITPDDPRWVGAWWIGYLLVCVMSLCVAFLIACFPKELPAAKENLKGRVSESYKGMGDDVGRGRIDYGKSPKEFLMSLKLVLSNPVFLLVIMTATIEGGCVMSFAIFLPKILQFQFEQVPSMAALLSGIVIFPGAACGQIIGGLVCKLLKLRLRGLLLQCMTCSLVCIALVFVILIRCDGQTLAGINTPYANGSDTLSQAMLTQPCNINCTCTTLSYEPICGADHLQYFSPCHAACRHSDIEDGKKVYSSCGCIDSDNRTDTQTEAIAGICGTDCSRIFIFLPFAFLLTVITAWSNVSGIASIVRCLPERQKGLGIAIKGMTVRFLGTMPAPVLFGTIFDDSCMVWQDHCGVRGSCWVYDTASLSLRLTILVVVVKVISSILLFTASMVYRPPAKQTENNTEVPSINLTTAVREVQPQVDDRDDNSTTA